MRWPLWLATSLLACESTGAGDDPDRGTRGNVLLRDEHNYQTTSALSVPTIETAAETDLDICWTDVTSDLQCHDVAPQEDIDNVALLRFLHLSEEQVEQRLTEGQLAMSEVDGYLEYNTEHDATCAKLSSMSFFGTPIEIEEEYRESDDHRYMLLFAAGTTPGVGARSMTFVKPTSTSTNTMVMAEPSCGFLDFSADLSAVEPVSIPIDGPWVIDWRDLTLDSQGNEIVFESIDSVLVGFYQDMTPEQLQAEIFDLELLATELYRVTLKGGRTADLERARAVDGGAAFAGFERDAEGTWLLGLMCSACQNPAPVLLAILEPVAGDS
jgi:hypothetical protein